MADGSLSKKHDLFVRIQQRAAEATRRLAEKQEQEAAKPQQMFLPGLEEFMRAMPNPVARSSLFAPVEKGRKKIHDGEIVLETPTFIIRFWGRQLDEAQADLWMQLMYEASKAPLGEPVIINRAALLRAIGRSTGKPMYVFFFQAEDGIRYDLVTGVQTCALPISASGRWSYLPWQRSRKPLMVSARSTNLRSEERRVGKECRSRWSPDHYKKKENRYAYQSTRRTQHNRAVCARCLCPDCPALCKLSERRTDEYSRHRFFFSSRRRHTR